MEKRKVERTGEHPLLSAAAVAVRGDVSGGAQALCEAIRKVSGTRAVALAVRSRGGWRVIGATARELQRWRAWKGMGVVLSASRDARLLLVGAVRAPLPSLALSLSRALAERHRSEQARRERELELLRRERLQVRALARTRDDIRRAAHDLKTPLSVMKGYLDMFGRGLAGPLSPQMTRYLERIAASVDRQEAIAEALLIQGARRSTPHTHFDLRHELQHFLDGLASFGTTRLVRCEPLPPSSPIVVVGHSAPIRMALRAMARRLAHTLPEGTRVRFDLERAEAGWLIRLWTHERVAIRGVLELLEKRVGGFIDEDGALLLPTSGAWARAESSAWAH